MPDLTPPPPMSDAALWDIHKAWLRAEECYNDIDLMQMAIAARDEQWRRRLEHVGTTDLDGNLMTLTALPDGTPLYRIKEQG